MRRLVLAVTALLLLTPEPAQTAPAFPITLVGWMSWGTAYDSDRVPWVWYVYADGTYDHGEQGVAVPSPGYSGGEGNWVWAAPTLTLVTPLEGYRGNFDGLCVDGQWVERADRSTIIGLFQACPIR